MWVGNRARMLVSGSSQDDIGYMAAKWICRWLYILSAIAVAFELAFVESGLRRGGGSGAQTIKYEVLGVQRCIKNMKHTARQPHRRRRIDLSRPAGTCNSSVLDHPELCVADAK